MRILPILFNTDMVRALLENRKSATRRVIKGVETSWTFQGMEIEPAVIRVRRDGEAVPQKVKGLYACFSCDTRVWFPLFRAPYEPGDILYVRETWCNVNKPDFEPEYYYFADTKYVEDYYPSEWKWRPSIHMPKEAARIFLKVKDVRVERLQDITEEQARAEGVGNWNIGMGESGFSASPNSDTFFEGPVGAFRSLWDIIVKPDDLDKYGWTANPWVWVIEFERVDKPEGWPYG